MKGTPTVKHIPTLLCILPLLAPLARLRAAESDTLDLDKRTSQGIPFRHNKPSLLAFPDGIQHVRVERSDSDKYRFLHDSAMEAHRGELFAAWYNCPQHEAVAR